jgi:Ca-activated chloride channel family protein
VDTDSDFLPRLWATRKIGHLLDEVRLRDGEAKKELVDQIIALSKEFGVLTPYTAYFVPEPGTELRRSDGPVSSAGTKFDRITTMRPSARMGESAVNASQGARGQRTQNQVGNVYTYADKAGAERKRDEALAQRIQNVASRTFYQVGPVWTDATYDAKKQKQVVQVRLYSPAYFALVRRNADLAKWASVGEQVLVAANATQAVQFGPEGRESLTDAELKALAGK